MLSSPHDSPFILVLFMYKIFAKFRRDHPCGGAKQRWGMKMSQFSTNNLLYLGNGWKYMGICSMNPLSTHVTFTAIVPGAYPGSPKCANNVLKWWTFEFTGWITGKLLKTDEYMLRGIWQALNPLLIHVTITAILPGAYQGEAKMCLRLSCGSQMPPPAKRVKATTYRRDCPEV